MEWGMESSLPLFDFYKIFLVPLNCFSYPVTSNNKL